MGRRSSHVLVGVVLLLGLVAGTSTASAADGLSATKEGRPISLKEAGTLSCHDLDYPVLRCYASPTALRTAVAARTRIIVGRQFSIAAGSVTVYEDAGYGGSAMSLSADQQWLSTIGWNDRISSFKSFGATGNFRQNSPTGGFTYPYATSTQVSSLSSTYNDKFSAFNID